MFKGGLCRLRTELRHAVTKKSQAKFGGTEAAKLKENKMYPPERIVCLTEETTETLYLLGEQHRIVGISGYTVRPPQARKEKPRVSAFISADIPKILALNPDLVLTFSDLQADIVAALIREGISVHAFNQRTVAGILDMIRTLGALVDATDRAKTLADRLAPRYRQHTAAQQQIAAPAQGLFRGMGRTDDHRHRLGIGADRDRRRQSISLPSLPPANPPRNAS